MELAALLTALTVLMPKGPSRPYRTADEALIPWSSRWKVIVSGPVLIALVFSALGQTGFFTADTYIAPTLEKVSGFGGSAIALMLLIFGIGGFIGKLVGGRLADRNLPRALVWLMLVLAVAVAVVALSLAAPSKPGVVVALVFLGAAGFSVVPAYQTWVLGAANGAPSALAANTSGINVGIALGSFIGGAAIGQGLSERNLGWIGAIATLLGAAIAAAAVRRARNRSTKNSDAIDD